MLRMKDSNVTLILADVNAQKAWRFSSADLAFYLYERRGVGEEFL